MGIITQALDQLIFGEAPVRKLKLLKAIPEGLRSSAFDHIRQKAFRRTIRHCAQNSPFYRRKFQEYGIDWKKIRDPQDLGEFFTKAEDFTENPIEDFLCCPPQVSFETTGTTGRPKKMFFTYEEMRQNARRLAAAMIVFMGVKKEDRILNAYDFSFWFPGYLFQTLLPYIGAFSCTVGKIDPEEVYRRMPDYRFNIILADPTWVLRFTEIAQGRERFPIKLFLCGGEMITEDARKAVEEFWGGKLLMTYASVDAGSNIGSECPLQTGYHINEFDLMVEIVEPDSSGYGEVVLTTLTRTTMPLIRCRTKDIAKIIEEPCRCGFPSKRLSKILGRKDEIVVCGAGHIHPAHFEDILRGIPSISPDWQIAVYRKERKEIVEFRLELLDSQVNKEEITGKIKEIIQERYKEMWRNYIKGIYDLQFVYFLKGELRTKRKIKRVVDERQ